MRTVPAGNEAIGSPTAPPRANAVGVTPVSRRKARAKLCGVPKPVAIAVSVTVAFRSDNLRFETSMRMRVVDSPMVLPVSARQTR